MNSELEGLEEKIKKMVEQEVKEKVPEQLTEVNDRLDSIV